MNCPVQVIDLSRKILVEKVMEDFEKEKIRKAEKNFGWKVYARKFRDLEGGFKIAILFGCFAILLIIFCFEAKWIEKFHVSATVVIAAVACMLQYSSHQERKSKERESSIMKYCETIVSIINDDKIVQGNISLSFFGEDGKIIKSTNQRYVCIDCQYVYSQPIQRSCLVVTVRVSRDEEGQDYDDYFHHIKYITTSSTRFLTNHRCYSGSPISSNDPIVPVPVEVSSYSDLEWREMIGALSFIIDTLAIDGVKKTVQDHQNSSSGTQQGGCAQS